MQAASACPVDSSEPSTASSSPTLTNQPPKPAGKIDGAEKKGKKAKQGTTAKTFRFTPASDIALLKIVTYTQPWAAGHGKKASVWSSITDTLQEALKADQPLVEKVKSTAVQRRFEHLVTCFKQEEMESLKASGTEEEYGEREALLSGIVEMMRDYEEEKKEKTEKEKAETLKKEQTGEKIMRAAAAGQVKAKRGSLDGTEKSASAAALEDEGDDGQTSTRKRRKSASRSEASTGEVLRDYLEMQETRKVVDHSLQERQLSLQERMEERQMALQEERLAMEKERMKLDGEREDKKMRMEQAREENNHKRESQLFAMMTAVLSTLAELKK
ncbi:hypothetical protein HDU96_007819 [Phlyctochytrium bullatum]|nr:hypothetical protein HDU96_007819 [Phlyctochytrium bullatum]